MPANATVFLPSEAALEALGEEGREALRQDKYLFVTFIYGDTNDDHHPGIDDYF